MRDEDRNERERVKGGATSSGNSSLPFRSRDYLGKTRSPQTVPAGCSAFVWTRVKRDSIERKTVTGMGANKISRYNNIGAHRLARPTGRSNKPCDWSAANPKFTRPSATILRFVLCPRMDRLFIFPNPFPSSIPFRSPIELCQQFTTPLQLTMKVATTDSPASETRMRRAILREMESRRWLKNGIERYL